MFDIREFAIHDGPGIRTTVFMKGCPLKCSWCHNPEGISPEPQAIKTQAGDRTVGSFYTAAALAAILNRQSDILSANEGGVTFSGGEPLMQAQFLVQVLDLLHKQLHVVLDTSGYASESVFRMVVRRMDLVYFDLKIMDTKVHEQFTGKENAPILSNLNSLAELGVPFVVRVPLIPDVTDTDKNLLQIAQSIAGLRGLLRVDLLPFNRAAGGKYASVGLTFTPGFNESDKLNPNVGIFVEHGIEVRVV